MTIYDRIKARREELGMSQQQLADKIGYKSRSAINKIESGLRDINQTKIKAFAEALNTTPAYLMGWDEKESTNNSELDSQIEDLYNSLPEDKQQQAIEFLKFLQGK